jgi:hypothetical protein
MSDYSETDALLAEAALGREAEQFINTNIGKYLSGCCEQEIRMAQDELSTVSWWRHRRIKQLQNQVWRARSFSTWMTELVNSGRVAEETLSTYEVED